ncbi:hypothetical protein PLESTF_000710300 [Pleodorina starrii]|nr:hypothetical protein PLESTM_001799500 [Pleodorina starrii]GLC68575.1 hypothetical protein PLESTF_000710300 [Pleodorina starrii]
MDAAASISERLASHGVHLKLSEQTALNHIRCIVNECSGTVSASALARELALRGVMVTLRTSLPKGFHSLKHQYLIVQTHDGGAAIVIDVEFRDRFHYTGLPGGSYAACVAALPQLLIATMATVTAIARMMSDALEREAAAQRHDLPPWRSRRALFANWHPERFTDDVFAPPGATLHPVLLHTHHSQPAFQFQPSGSGVLPAPLPSWDSPDMPTGMAAGDDQDIVSGSSSGSSSSLLRTHGSKRKAEAAAGGDSSSAKAPGPKARSPQPAQQLWPVLQRTVFSTGSARVSNAVPPCVITGFSAPSPRTTAVLGPRVISNSSSSSGSSSSDGSGSSGSSSGSNSNGGVMGADGGSGHSGPAPCDNPTQRRGSSDGSGSSGSSSSDGSDGSGSSGSSSSDGSGSSGSSSSDGSGSSGSSSSDGSGSSGSSSSDGIDGSSSNGGGCLISPFLAAVLPTDAAADATADGQPVTHGTAAASLERRVSGLTRKLLGSGAVAAGAVEMECARSSSSSRDLLGPVAISGLPGLKREAGPPCDPAAAAAAAAYPLNAPPPPPSNPARPATYTAAAAAAAVATTAAVAAVTADAACEVGCEVGDVLDGAGTAAAAAGQPCQPCTPGDPLQPQPVVVWQHQACAPTVAAAAAAVGSGAAGSKTVPVGPESPPPAVRLLRCKAAEVLPRIFKVRPKGWGGSGVMRV